MLTEPDDTPKKADDQPAPEQAPFKGLSKYVEEGGIAGLMCELDKADAVTRKPY